MDSTNIKELLLRIFWTLFYKVAFNSNTKCKLSLNFQGPDIGTIGLIEKKPAIIR